MRKKWDEMQTQSLLVRTREIMKLLQRKERANFEEIANTLRDVIDATTYIVANTGELRGFAPETGMDCEILNSEVLEQQRFSEEYTARFMARTSTEANIELFNHMCDILRDKNCFYDNKYTTVVPIYGAGERLASFVLTKVNERFTDGDLILAEYAATVIGIQLLNERNIKLEEEAHKKAMVKIAFSTLSFSELEAIDKILHALHGNTGLLVASKIADEAGITRSVIVNALRKFESAGLLETRSLGMKGTHIRLLNEYLLEALDKQINH